MDMEVTEEFMMGSNDHTQVAKGKRTKRQRPSSPFGASVTSSSSSGGGDGRGGGDFYSLMIPSPTSSGEISAASTEEDEDMANCLILLAQGGCPTQVEEEPKIEKFSSRRFTGDMTTTTTTTTTTTAKAAGFYVYECKTCNRTFPSFQALGGHRASHKKPKATAEEKKAPVMPLDDDGGGGEGQFNKISPPLSLPLSLQIHNKGLHSNKQPKIHECSVCGSEFSSGQALGGHMRRHRTPTTPRISMDTTTSTTTESSHDGETTTTKPRNILSLDLNLPAVAEDDHHRDSKFQFTHNQQHLVFSAPALVDCHY